LLLATALVAAAAAAAHAEFDYERYLERFGYLDRESFQASNSTEALLLFQRTFRLKETGIVDQATLKLMNTPRCGNHDHGKHAYSDVAWSRTDLSYYYYNYSPDLSQGEIRSMVSEALGLWSAVTPLTFREQEGGDINIGFGSYTHQDSHGTCPDRFDGPSNVLAHAYFPEIGRIHFDEDETWTSHSQSGINFLWVSTHEMGHILGLEHDTVNEDAVMYPYYRQYTPGFHLHRNDIARIQRLYGSGGGGGGRPRPTPGGGGGGKHGGSCHAIGAWAGNPGMDQWCTDNCHAGNCPATMCKCD